MTDQEIHKIEEGAKRATPGPWHWHLRGETYLGQGDCECLMGGEEGRLTVLPSLSVTGEPNPLDARFIAHARTNIPKLCKKVRELQQGLMNREETISKLKEEVRRLKEWIEKDLLPTVGEADE